MIEYDCRDCGVHVYAIGIEHVPEPPLCLQCKHMPGWLDDPRLVAMFDPERLTTKTKDPS
jgi:hypothetical protein